MTALKDLTKLKVVHSQQETGPGEDDLREAMTTYFQRGFSDSKDSLGHPSGFTAGLADILESYKEDCRQAKWEQSMLKQPIVEEQGRVQKEIDRKETFLDIKQRESDDLGRQVQEIDNNIAEAKINPEKHGIKANKRPKAQFYIGLLVLLPITIYLVDFYMSASYSAFFKEFSTDRLTAAIFDAQTFSKALQEGVMEVLFVSTIPFAFMGLGYLMHMFQKSKSTGKIIALFAVTFMFDVILAYQIEKKVYDFNRTLNSPDFDLQHAFQNVGFWGIIFAGFVVYIIWGLVFDFIMKEYDNLNKVRQFIRKLKEDKRNLLKRLDTIKLSMNTVTEEVSGLKNKVKELQAQIDGFIFPKQKYLVFHAKYVRGWISAIFKEIDLPGNEKDRLIYACQAAEKDHFKKYELDETNAETILYYTKPDLDD